MTPDDAWPLGPLTGFTSMLAGYVTLYVAVPIFFVVRRSVQPSARNIALTGALIGVAPGIGAAATAIFNVGRVPRDVVALAAFGALSGTVGGVVFWLCAVWRSRRFVQREPA